MDSYSELASCYDIFMEDVPYDEWLEYILDVFKRYNVPKELVLDLGCGTGKFTRMLSKEGYDMIGVDSSVEMLGKAREAQGEDDSILYLLQDMREFELYGTVRAVVSVCDSINYLLSDEDIVNTFLLVENYLDKDGIFVFDFNTVYKYEEVIGDTTIAENREDHSFIWENIYSSEDRINEYDLTIFSREGELFRRSSETHFQRGYTLDDMKSFLKSAHLEFLEARDADTGSEPSETSERIQVVSRCIREKMTYKEE